MILNIMRRSLALGIALAFLVACNGERALRRDLEAANHCEQTSDCVVLYSKCPIDCYALVHADEADAMNARIEAFHGGCDYSCAERPAFACVEGKCRFQY